MEVYTLGHSNYTLERLAEMLRYFNINCVVDIRGTPYSKYNIQFDKEKLQYSLTKAGFIYIYMGIEFAANRINKISYNQYGYSDFEKVSLEEDFKKGIIRIKDGCTRGYRIVLLGAMQDPIRCHRSILVGKALIGAGFRVNHILDDYTLVNQSYIEDRLLDKYFKDRAQISIDNLLGTALSEKDMIREAYRLANREIGLRVENLNKQKDTPKS